jgi:tRNA(Ile)-lysidine synthase
MLKEFQSHLSGSFPFLKDSRLLIAVSGGIDSMVLVYLLKQLEYDISIAHCNFGLRGEESDGDEEFVRHYAKDHRIKLFSTRFDTASFAADNKLSIQVAARQLRYIWFHQLLEENNLDYILTAHHLDDSLETFLINFTRGTGLDGLTGIPNQNDKVIRPLLPFTRDDIEVYAKFSNIAWREDSSNASGKYMRNKLRHNMVPMLKEFNPSFAESFSQTLANLQQAESLVHDAAILMYQQVVAEKEGQKHINLSQLLRLPNYKAYLYQWLKPFGFTAWDDIYALVAAQPGKQVYAPGYKLLKDRETLILEGIKPADRTIYEIAEGVSRIDFPIPITLEIIYTFSNIVTKNAVFVNNNLIKFPLFVRKWQEGDYFYPLGMNGQKKKVSKYFKDEKMSLSEKENTWLLCSGNDIIWIIGRRADDRYKVDHATDTILKIEVL